MSEEDAKYLTDRAIELSKSALHPLNANLHRSSTQTNPSQ